MYADKLAPWRSAQLRRTIVDLFTIPFKLNTEYWNIWGSVICPMGNPRK